MRRQIQSAASMLILLFVAACTGTSPIVNPDWCYTLDFTQSSYGATITNGTWNAGDGFRSSGGTLNISYNHSSVVQPSYVEGLIFVDNAGSTVTFNVTANIFGVPVNYADTAMNLLSSYVFGQNATSPNQFSRTATISATSSAPVAIRELRIEGVGPNPFPSNDCIRPETATPTPQGLPTLIPTYTPLPSSTPPPSPTPSPTFTPSPTPENTAIPDGWSCTWDFTGGSGAWRAVDGGTGRAQYISGQGWARGTLNNNSRLEIETISEISAQITALSVTYNRQNYVIPANSTVYVNLRNAGYLYPVFSSGQTLVNWTNATPITITNDRLQVRAANGGAAFTPAFPADLYITSLTMYGPGTKPNLTSCVETVSPTGTPNPTVTPTITPTDGPSPTAPPPTATPTYEEYCTFINPSFNSGLVGWTTTGDQAAGAVVMVDADTISQSVPLTGTNYYLIIRASIDDWGTSQTDGLVAFDYVVTLPDTSTDPGTITAVSESDFTRNNNEIRFVAPITTILSGSHGFQVIADLTNVDSIQIREICLSPILPDDLESDSADNDGYGWSQCGDQISSPSSIVEIGGWIQFLWSNVDQTVQCTIMPPITNILNTVIAFFGWTIQTAIGFFEWISGTLLPYLTASLSNFFQILLQLVSQGFSGFTSLLQNLFDQILVIGDVIGAAGDIASGYVDVVRAYVNLGQVQIGNVVTAYQQAPATAPPGMPFDCVAAPLDTDICAVYYVAENTLLSGPLGGLLIPVLAIIIDVIVLMYFSNSVRKFIRWFLELVRT